MNEDRALRERLLVSKEGAKRATEFAAGQYESEPGHTHQRTISVPMLRSTSGKMPRSTSSQIPPSQPQDRRRSRWRPQRSRLRSSAAPRGSDLSSPELFWLVLAPPDDEVVIVRNPQVSLTITLRHPQTPKSLTPRAKATMQDFAKRNLRQQAVSDGTRGVDSHLYVPAEVASIT